VASYGSESEDASRKQSTVSQNEPTPIDESHPNRKRHLSVFFATTNGEEPVKEDADTVSIQSEHYGEFWDEYETVLENLVIFMLNFSWNFLV